MDPEEVDVELPVPASPDSASSPEKPITPPRTYLEPVRNDVIKKEKEAREITREKAKETPPLVQERAPVQSPTANQPVQYSLQRRQEEQTDEVADTQETSNDEVSVEMPLVAETKPQAKMAAPVPAQRPLALAAPVPAQRPLPQIPIEVPKKDPPSWTQQVSPAQCLPQQSSVSKSYYPDEVDVEIDVVASPTTSPPTPSSESMSPPLSIVLQQPASSLPQSSQPSWTRQAAPAKSPKPPQPTLPARTSLDPDEVDVEIDVETSSPSSHSPREFAGSPGSVPVPPSFSPQPKAKASVESMKILVSTVLHRNVHEKSPARREAKSIELDSTRRKNLKEVKEITEEDEESDEDSSDTD